MSAPPLTVAWFSYFPVEWLPDAPEPVRSLPRIHPAPWQSVLLAELENMPDLRLHILVLRKQFPRHLTFERHGVTFHCLRTWAGLRAPSFFWVDTVLIGRRLRRIRPDLVHAWGTENGAALVAARLRYPALVTMQGLMSWLTELVPANRYTRFAARLERWALRRASVVTVESKFAARYLQAHYAQLDLHQVEHAPNWLFHQVQRQPRRAPPRFIWVGSLNYGKGADLLFEALASLLRELEFELVIVGPVDAEALAPFRAKLPTELWSRVAFRGYLTSRQVAEEYAAATLLLYPTRADNSPNSVKEAVVAGLPVVASAIGGIVDYVAPGKNGVLFPPGNLAEFRQAIRSACSHPLLGQGRVEPSVLAQVREYLSPATMGRQFRELYFQTAQRAGAGAVRHRVT
jgi:glycosyltransferase involved in cell wall biosynthesis